jgi:putative pyruvate formate lyase activating enzyme
MNGGFERDDGMQGGFVVDPFEPAYLSLAESGRLGERVWKARGELKDCRVCPRDCGVDRAAGEMSVCKTGRHARVASASPHHGEERCLSGFHGSGTIFFSCCNLHCEFCQNWDISQQAAGTECPAGKIAELMIALQERGCHNINFVTPEHVVPQVIEAVGEAVPRGLSIPIVYNTSAYDSLESLALLDGIVDIYMPDFKFWKTETSRRYLKAKDYPDRARQAIREMHRQVGPLRMGPDGIARRGVLVRHLVMPGMLDETAAILEWISGEISRDTFINIMGQYRPEYRVGLRESNGTIRHEEINRTPTGEEMSRALAAGRDAGLYRFD